MELFNRIAKAFKSEPGSKTLKADKSRNKEQPPADIQGETHAAIALAIHLYLSELHDQESNMMTIRKISKLYSPWSSKIYGMRNLNFYK